MALTQATGDLFGGPRSSTGTLLIIDGRSKAIVHRSTVAGSPVGLTLDTQRNRAFVLSATPQGKGILVGVDLATGRRLFRTPVGESPEAVAVAERVGRVFVLTCGGLDSVDATTGVWKERLSIGPPPGCGGAIAVDQQRQRVFTTGDWGGCHSSDDGPGCLTTVDAQAGTEITSTGIYVGVSDLAVDARHGLVAVLSGGRGGSGQVDILNVSTGVVSTTTDIICHGGRIAVDSRSGRIFALDTPGQYEFNGPPVATVLDLRTGRIVRTTTLPTHWEDPNGTITFAAIGVDERSRQVFVATQEVFYAQLKASTLDILDGQTGALLARRPLGRGPHAFAVDEAQGRVYIANRRDGTLTVVQAGSPRS